MTTEEGLIVGNYVHKNPSEDPEVSAQNLLPKFNGKYDYTKKFIVGEETFFRGGWGG